MLRFEQVALRRGPRLLFEQVSFQAFAGQRFGLTGANGTGKSSLFELVLEQLHSDAGEVTYPGDWVVAHVAQETPSDSRAAIELVLDGDAELRRIESGIAQAEREDDGDRVAMLHGQLDAIDGYAAPSRAGQLMRGLGFSPGDEERPVSSFSGGWRMRLNLARALMCRSDLLLLDEPTNHLDLDTVIWLETWLKSYRGALLLIAHDREFLDAVTTHIAHIEHGHVTVHAGNYSEFERWRAQQLAVRQAAYEKQQKEIAHIRSFVDRFRAKATKARQAQSRIKALERMESIAPAHVDSPFRFGFSAPEKTPFPLLQLDHVAAGYDDVRVLDDVGLTLNPGDRVGLLGRNGAGKSTLIKLMAGMLTPGGGRIEKSRDTRIGYFAQHQLEQLDPERTPLDHLRDIDESARESDLRNFLGGFGFSNERALLPTLPFSGGEKSRLALALIVYRKPNLLLLDEPTNHLDIEMRQALAMALQGFSGAMVIVSHDRHLLRTCCDDLLLVDGGNVGRFRGTLDDYPDWLRETALEADRRRPGPSRSASAADRKEQRRREAEHRQRLKPLRKEVAEAERSLSELQALQASLESSLADPAMYEEARKQDLKELLARKSEVDNACRSIEETWLRLSEKLEAEDRHGPAVQ